VHDDINRLESLMDPVIENIVLEYFFFPRLTTHPRCAVLCCVPPRVWWNCRIRVSADPHADNPLICLTSELRGWRRVLCGGAPVW